MVESLPGVGHYTDAKLTRTGRGSLSGRLDPRQCDPRRGLRKVGETDNRGV